MTVDVLVEDLNVLMCFSENFVNVRVSSGYVCLPEMEMSQSTSVLYQRLDLRHRPALSTFAFRCADTTLRPGDDIPYLRGTSHLFLYSFFYNFRATSSAISRTRRDVTCLGNLCSVRHLCTCGLRHEKRNPMQMDITFQSAVPFSELYFTFPGISGNTRASAHTRVI